MPLCHNGPIRLCCVAFASPENTGFGCVVGCPCEAFLALSSGDRALVYAAARFGLIRRCTGAGQQGSVNKVSVTDAIFPLPEGLVMRPLQILRRIVLSTLPLVPLIVWPLGVVVAYTGAIVTVTSTADNGAGTLRAALNSAVHGTTIVFSSVVFPPGAPKTIALSSSLPAITQGGLTLDGSGAGVVIDGRGISQDADCLALLSDGNTVRGLHVGGCKWTSVSVWGANNTVVGNVLFGSGDGVGLWGPDAHDNRVIGNTIGPDPSVGDRPGNICGSGA